MGPPNDVHPRRRKTHSSLRRSLNSLLIVEQRHEPVVHVQLLVAMEEGKSWIVRAEVDLCFLVATDHHHILQNAGGRLPGNPAEFKGMPVQVNRVDVITGIPHPQAIPLALSKVKGWR